MWSPYPRVSVFALHSVKGRGQIEELPPKPERDEAQLSSPLI